MSEIVFNYTIFISEHGLEWVNLTQMTIISEAGIPQKKWSSHYGQQKSPKCSTDAI